MSDIFYKEHWKNEEYNDWLNRYSNREQKFNNVRTLFLRGSEITSLPESIGSLIDLSILNLSNTENTKTKKTEEQ